MVFSITTLLQGRSSIFNTLLAPVQCFACEVGDSYICRFHRKFLLKHPPQCYICHTFSPYSHVCDTHTKNPIKGILVGFYYTRLIQDSIYQAKYHSSYHFLSFFAQQLLYDIYTHPQIMGAIINKTLIISYIPMHWWKERHIRGYNQAQKLALYLASQLKVPCLSLCSKQYHTRTQTSFSREQRIKNQQDVFTYSSALPLPPNSTILVVDDIVTTGSTLLAFAKAVKAGMSSSIWGLCVARHG